MKRLIMSLVIIFMITGTVGALADTETVTPVVRGVDLISATRTTDKGTQNISVVRADLNNPNLSIKTLFSDEGVSTLENVKTLADEHKAIAAVNADFFAWDSAAGRGSAIGYNVVDGELMTTPCITENVAAAATNEKGETLFAYFERAMTVTAPNGESAEIKHINKFDDLSGIVMYTPAWGKLSLGSSGTQVEVVVENDTVKEIRTDKPPAEIPADGYILAGLSDVTGFLTQSIQVGDKLKLDIRITPDFDAQNAVGGGTILVTEGQEAKITHNISGQQPRSAFGVDKTGKIVYLITVDGRGAGGSIGMTLEELRSYMIDLGVYNGINFDGGGSTQLAVRPLGESESTVMNTPCETPYRRVANALGIVSTGKAGVADMVKVTTEMPAMFVNTGIGVSAKLYDQQYEEMETADVDYSVAGVKGTIENGVFVPSTAGTATVTAAAGKITGSAQVEVLASPDSLKLDSDTYYMQKGERKAVTMTGYVQGRDMIYINPVYAKLTQTDSIVRSIDGGLEATGQGTAKITYQLGNATVSATVYVEGDSDVIDAEFNNQTDRFETGNAGVYVYPDDVTGAYKISNEKAVSGRTSGKLWYDFLPQTDEVQSAGFSFTEPKPVTNPDTQISVNVYASKNNRQWLRCMLTDANGELYRLDLAQEVNWDGWKTLSVKVPEQVALPARLTKLYLVQPDKDLHTKGAMYFDDLTIRTMPAVSVSAGLEREQNLISNLANMRMQSKLVQSGVWLDMSRGVDGFTVKSHNGVALMRYKQFMAADSATEQTLVVVADEAPVQTALPAFAAGKTVIFVYPGEETKSETKDSVQYVSLDALQPLVSEHQNKVDVLNVYISDGQPAVKVEQIKLW